MASIADTPRIAPRILSWIKGAFHTVAEARARTAQFELLNAKSDADLKAMGLTRADLVRYVYRDML